MPPNLDPKTHKTSRLHLICPPSLLDALPGVAGLLDTDGKWCSLSRYWDRLMSRANRPEWSRDALLGRAWHELFDDQRQQAQAKNVFVSLSQGKLEQHAQTVEFGAGARALHVEMVLRPLSVGGSFAGVLVQLLDVTRDYLNRISLLDRERKLRDLQERTETQTTEYAEAMARRTLEHSREMAALHEEVERLSFEQTAQLAQTKDTYQAAMRKLGDRPAQQIKDFSERAAKMAAKFREHPREFGSRLGQIFKDLSGCYFTTVYHRTPDKQGFVICAECEAPEALALAARHGYTKLAEGEGTVGLAAMQGEPMKFAHLLDSADYGPWAHLAHEYGYNCLWAIPLRSNDETCGVVQLYYREPEAALPADQRIMLAALAQVAAPLLQASEETVPQPSKNGKSPEFENCRTVIGELADEYGTLLTGMLGHSTLAAAELGDAHAAREDLRAIERAARSAAKLTRRLAALSGTKDKATVVELGEYVRKYLQQHRLSSSAREQAELPVAPCEVRAEVAALEIIIDGIVEYARACVSPEAAPLWTLIQDGHAAHLTLLFDGNGASSNGGLRLAEPLGFRLSREAARALGGEIEVNRTDGQTAMVLTLPVEEEKAETLKS